MTVQFVEVAGERMAMLPEREYRRLLDAAEESADIQAAIAAEHRASSGEEDVPMALLQRLADGESPLLVWRTYRQLSPAQLAAKSGVSEQAIASMEAGDADIGAGQWRPLAQALSIDVEDLLPLES